MSASTAPAGGGLRRRMGGRAGASRARAAWRGIGTYAALAAAGLLMLVPFVLAILVAFTSPQQFAAEGVTIPWPPTVENFLALGDLRVDMWQAVGTTFAVVAVVTLGQLLFSTTAAFAFARMRFPGRELLFWLFLATLMVPQAVTVIPLYFIMSEAGFYGSFLGLVLPFLFGSPYAIFLLREQFRQIPQELLDAMRMDGAGTLRILFGLVVPLSKPTLVTLLLITVVTHWNNFMWPLMIGANRIHVITTATAALQEQHQNNFTLMMAASMLAMIPLIVLFVVFQRRIVDSIRITGFR